MQEARNLENLRIDLSVKADDIWDDELSFAGNLKSIFDQTIAIPDRAIQLPILISYACLPSALCNVVPILFLQGREGTGKSTAAIVIASIFGQEMFSAATSFAAIRNSVQSCRWYLPESQEQERNFGIVFDNVNENTFRDEKLYTFFLNGYNRKTDRMEISKGDGTNMLFKVFCPKVCSSIHPLYSNPKLTEISRRMLPIKFKRIEEMSDEDIGSFDVYNRLDVDNIDLSVLNEKYNLFWREDNSAEFMRIKKELVGKDKKYKIPKRIKSHHWALTVDMICAGCVTGLWKDPFFALMDIEKYWEWYDLNISSSVSSFTKACKMIIKNITGTQDAINRQLGLYGNLEIPCSVMKNELDLLNRNGALDDNPTPRNITQVMTSLGWHRTQNESGVWVWTEIK
jgi:hypothetical protein